MLPLVDQYGTPFPAEMLRPSASTRSFANASRGRLNPGTRGPLGSANSHRDARTLENLIRDCEDSGRNNHIMRALMSARSDFVVGDNPGLEARTSDQAFNAMVESRFRAWCDGFCDAAGQMTLAQIAGSVINAFDTSGGILAHKVIGPGRRPRIEMIEAIRLQNPGRRADTKLMHAGVELSESTNRPIRYHIAEWNDQGTSLSSKTSPIDASNAWLINNPRLLAPNQHRAEPHFASVIDRLETIDMATESTWDAYQIATHFALFITRESAAGQSIGDAMGQAAVNAGLDRNTADAIERGAFNPLAILEGRVGESVTQIKPEHPTTGFEAMFWTEMASIATAVDMPLELAMMRFTNNFAASRSAMSVGWKKIKVLQRVLTARFLSPVYQWWLAAEQLAGRIEVPEGIDSFAHEWFLPSMPSLDPKAETEAVLMKLSGGLMLHEQGLRELGQGDRDQFMGKFAKEARENLKAGLSYSRPKSEFVSEIKEDEEPIPFADEKK